ncbi:MAG: 6-carboxytetrahydropterin synthase [Alistipes sp.]|nr:6-carboxytetrahydropterin synthase [Alistipes sp.]
MIRLTKEFTFEAAHVLWGYDGLCRELHGHSYRLYVTVVGEPVADDSSPKLGMVMDFGELKAIVSREVVSRLDHSLILRRSSEAERLLGSLEGIAERIVVVDYQPTCENMLYDFAHRIDAALPQGVRLHSLRLHETATSYAEWFAADNE